jgi:hypothetical protein
MVRILMRAIGMVLLAAGLAAGPFAAVHGDPIFRWVDSKGVVNYGNKPPETGPESRSVRAIESDPALVVHETDDEKSARAERLLASQSAEEARLKRKLLEEQIDAERARAELLRAQAAQSQGGSVACNETSADCEYSPYLVAWVRRAPRRDRPYRYLAQPMARPSIAPRTPAFGAARSF